MNDNVVVDANIAIKWVASKILQIKEIASALAEAISFFFTVLSIPNRV